MERAPLPPDFDEDRIKALTSLQLSDFEFDNMVSHGFEDMLQVSTDPIPANFTAAEKWQNCSPTILEIQDQSYCGSCWAVASATAMTDRLCISKNGSNISRLSFQDLLECCPNCGYKCSGGSTVSAYNYAVSTGLATGGRYLSTGNCKPYNFAPCSDPAWRLNSACTVRNTAATCRNTCQASFGAAMFEADKIKIKKSYRVIGGEVAIMQEIFNNGPVTAAFMVYQDFMNYKSGVYIYTNGSLLGGHAIKIIGWGTFNGVKYWLAMNPFATFTGCYPAHQICSVINHLLGMKTTFTSCNTLDEQTRIFIG